MEGKELKKVLKNHKLWINTEGEEGEQAALSEEVLFGKDLSGAELRFADLSGVNLESAVLKGVNLMGADLSDSDLCGADFSGADLSGTNLGGADFKGASLKNVSLEGANLSGVNLSGADLLGASLDFAAYPLWSGGIDVHIDDAQVVMFLYFLLKNVKYSKNVSASLKKLLLKNRLIDKANECGLAKECGFVEK